MTAVIVGADDAWQPVARKLCRLLQCRHAGVGHRQRATRALVGLVVQVHQRRPGDVRTGLIAMAPGESRDAVRDAQGHQRMIGRVEFHLVNASAIGVEGPELRSMPIRELAERHHFAAGQHAIGLDRRHGPVRAFPGECLAQRQVGGIGVVGR